jgi:hypothetical protein
VVRGDDGRPRRLAIEQARKVASKVPDEAMKGLPLLAGFRVVPYYALTRFGRFDEMLKEPAPPADNLYLTGIWHTPPPSLRRTLSHRGAPIAEGGRSPRAERTTTIASAAAVTGIDLGASAPCSHEQARGRAA